MSCHFSSVVVPTPYATPGKATLLIKAALVFCEALSRRQYLGLPLFFFE
jgi:hypothetical protein